MPREYSLKDTRNFGFHPLSALTVAAGLLVLMGAGCSTLTKSTENTLKYQARINSTSTAFSGNWPSRCFGKIDDITVFQKELTGYIAKGNPVPSNFISTLESQAGLGWGVLDVCVKKVEDTEGTSSAIFVLQNSSEIKLGYSGFAGWEDLRNFEGQPNVSGTVVSKAIPIQPGTTLSELYGSSEDREEVVSINTDKNIIRYYPFTDILK